MFYVGCSLVSRCEQRGQDLISRLQHQMHTKLRFLEANQFSTYYNNNLEHLTEASLPTVMCIIVS